MAISAINITDIYNNQASVFTDIIVYNNNYDSDLLQSNDPKLLDTLSIPNIFDNFTKFETLIRNNTYNIDIDTGYDFRPDKVALEQLGNQLLYPLILIANDLCSIFQFRPKNLQYKLKVPTSDTVKYILDNLN